MREICFRGKDVANNWHYGDLEYITDDFVKIVNHRMNEYGKKVEIGTIGQFTGLTDKNGKKIFEGDIVKISGALEGVYVCVWEEYNFEYEFNTKGISFCLPCVHSDDIEIIGNIHDNPELLEAEK